MPSQDMHQIFCIGYKMRENSRQPQEYSSEVASTGEIAFPEALICATDTVMRIMDIVKLDLEIRNLQESVTLAILADLDEPLIASMSNRTIT